MTTIAFIAGLAAIVAGVALIYPPAAFIVGGLGLIGLAVLSHDPDPKDRD